MGHLTGKQIVLGVTAGIAAYKSPDLVRRLREQGAEVQVVMTPSSSSFIGELSLQAVSGRPVRQKLIDSEAEAAMGHIELARWADLILVAPASADFMARLVQGMANDLLSTICLATTASIVLAPAMNEQMWQNQATQSNRQCLEGRGIRLLGPGVGEQACGEFGPGRMLEPTEIVADLIQAEPAGVLSSVQMIITAGPTQEPLDPVRFLSNHSSGKMGYAVAAAARDLGATVKLISGPVTLPAPAGVERIMVRTAAEMSEAVKAHIDTIDIFIATAAVADYRPEYRQTAKIKKDGADTADGLTLNLARTEDILHTVAQRPKPPFTVGFAAETDKLETYALSKLTRKNLDIIAANPVNDQGLGFKSDDNSLAVFWAGGRVDLPLQSKKSLARELMNVIVERWQAKSLD